MSATCDKRTNATMLDLPFFYEINLSLLMKRHKVIQLNNLALVIDADRYYSNSIWFKDPETFKYNRTDFNTLFKTIHQIGAKYFDWNYSQLQNVTNQLLEHNLQLVIDCTNKSPSNTDQNTPNHSPNQQININTITEQKAHNNDSPKCLNLLYKQLHSLQTESSKTEYETSSILTPKLIEVCQHITSLQLNELTPNQTNQLVLLQQQQNKLVQQINRNYLLFQQLSKTLAQTNKIYISEKSKQQSIRKQLLKELEMLTLKTVTIVSKKLLDAIHSKTDENACKQQIEEFISLILHYAIKRINLMKEYVQLCVYLHTEYSHNNNANLIRTIVVNKTRLLFIKTQQNQMNDKHSFFNVMKLMAELYLVDLFRANLIYKGILHRLLAPTNKQLSEIDMEGACKLLFKCGDMLDKVDTESYNKYIKILIDNSKSFGDNIIELVEDLKVLRNNNWRKSELQEKYNVLKHKHEELELKYNELHDKYVGIVKKSDYRLWNADEVITFIINIDQSKYSKYYEILMEKMIAENIHGTCLPNIDKNDLRRFGIINYKDNCAIHESIKALINNLNTSTPGKECVICMDGNQLYAVVPCGHLCICFECKDLIDKKCPLCKKECKSLMRIYS